MAISRRRLLAGLSCVPLAGCAASRTPAVTHMVAPELRVRVRAPWKQDLGELGDVAPELRAAFSDAYGYVPLPPPGPRGWRALQVEAPESVAEFRGSAPNLRTAPRDRIAVLPLGGFPFELVVDDGQVGMVRTPELSAIAAMLAAFFATPVDILPVERLPVRLLPRRVVAGHSQFDARALLNVTSIRLPADAHSMLVLVNVDLYVQREQQYAFGWSTLRDRVGVVGFSRLDPDVRGGEAADRPGALLRRGLRIAAHEVGHMFGLGHCQHFRCLMNGISDLAELDATPLRLCPLCLRKLHLVTGLDPRARDAALLRTFTALGLTEEATWLAARADYLWPGALADGA